MAIRYFQVKCKNCKREYSIQAEEGVTVKCNCPFCGTESTIAVPLLSSKNAEKKKQKLQSSNIGKKAILCFLIFAATLTIASIFLYILFTVMSN